MPIPQQVLDLIGRFDRNRADYCAARYNETELRRDFLDPFFGALGWDVSNEGGWAEDYRDVVHEDKIEIEGSVRAPDYCFRIGKKQIFFVEAKKPARNLKDDPSPAFQLRRYVWTAKMPLGILTDFQEFVVYDGRVPPVHTDKASTARLLYIPYTEYPSRWDEIASIFSRDAILQGSFEVYAQKTKAKKGTKEVDDAFLAEIESWRKRLAENMALRNRGLTQRELNFAVQMLIDRIIFLRICEDRGIEDYKRLKEAAKSGSVYEELGRLFRQADDRYNSGLFYFRKEKGRPESPDELSLQLTVDDKLLREIIRSLYYPYSPYEFSVLPADILGQVYEQFLGKVIRLTPNHQAKVEEKPEVRKAGGVYYTPTCIVDYIVGHTVGQLFEGKKPQQVEHLRILDPACGSGSFLIGAYQYLLDWYRKQYLGDPRHWARTRPARLYQTENGEWWLTTAERKRILLRHIYGVDIDRQAVEVTKLSLLLKVLEGETEQRLSPQKRLMQERVLPDLGQNIKCGNSLIGPDYYTGKQLTFLDEDDLGRVNVFDWSAEFPEIMRAGGFDVVIGNPPYLNIDDTWGKGDPRQRYIKRTYSTVYNDKTDILFYFLAKAVQLTKGEIGFIVSRAFLEAYKADKLRGWLASQAQIREIVDFQNYYVFEGVGITTAIVILSKTKQVQSTQVVQLKSESLRLQELDSQTRGGEFRHIAVATGVLGSAPWVFAESGVADVLQRIDVAGEPLGSVLFVGKGMETGRNDVFGRLPQDQVRAWGLQKGQYFTRVRNSDILRYSIRDSGETLIYLEDVAQFSDLPSPVRDYLKSREAELKDRAAFQRGNCEWWRYTWPLHRQYMRRAKLYCPYLATSNRFALDEEETYLGLTDTTVLYDAGQPEQLCYLMGLLNSRLLTFRFQFIGKLKSGGIREYFWNSISKLPIRRIDFSGADDKAKYNRMLELVQLMLNLHRQLATTRIPDDKQRLQRQISATDQQIDQLVYELYGLTPEEIKIVEEATQ